MPEISRFLGIIIAMYYNDHNPPHFHAKYGDFEAVIAIDKPWPFPAHFGSPASFSSGVAAMVKNALRAEAIFVYESANSCSTILRKSQTEKENVVTGVLVVVVLVLLIVFLAKRV